MLLYNKNPVNLKKKKFISQENFKIICVIFDRLLNICICFFSLFFVLNSRTVCVFLLSKVLDSVLCLCQSKHHSVMKSKINIKTNFTQNLKCSASRERSWICEVVLSVLRNRKWHQFTCFFYGGDHWISGWCNACNTKYITIWQFCYNW